MVRVPFQGATPLLTSTVGGHTNLGFIGLPPARPLIKDGKLRALVVVGSRRSADFPDVPTLDESMVVIRFKDPRGVDFPYLLRMLHDSFMSRANTIVIPGGKLDLAMQLILTPLIWKLMERRRQWV